jgi:hypothetical protein
MTACSSQRGLLKRTVTLNTRLKLVAEGGLGYTIQECLKDAKRIAVLLNITVSLKVNDSVINVTPTTNLETAYLRYMRGSNQHSSGDTPNL